MKQSSISLASLILMGVALLGIGFAGGWIFTWERYVQPELENQIQLEGIRYDQLIQEGKLWVLTQFAVYQDALKYQGKILPQLTDAIAPKIEIPMDTALGGE